MTHERGFEIREDLPEHGLVAGDVVITEALSGWRDDGLYMIELGRFGPFLRWAKVRTKKGTLRKRIELGGVVAKPTDPESVCRPWRVKARVRPEPVRP